MTLEGLSQVLRYHNLNYQENNLIFLLLIAPFNIVILIYINNDIFKDFIK